MYRKILIGGATAAVIVGSGGAALALSGSDSSGTTNGTPSSSASGSGSSGSSANGHASGSHAGKGQHGQGRHGRKGKRLLRRAAHGSFVMRTKQGFVTVDFAKGEVSSVSSSSVSVHTADNKTETFAVNKDTKVRSRHKGSKPAASSISKVSKGDRVIVFGTGTSTMTAKRIGDAGPKTSH